MNFKLIKYKTFHLLFYDLVVLCVNVIIPALLAASALLNGATIYLLLAEFTYYFKLHALLPKSWNVISKRFVCKVAFILLFMDESDGDEEAGRRSKQHKDMEAQSGSSGRIVTTHSARYWPTAFCLCLFFTFLNFI